MKDLSVTFSPDLLELCPDFAVFIIKNYTALCEIIEKGNFEWYEESTTPYMASLGHKGYVFRSKIFDFIEDFEKKENLGYHIEGNNIHFFIAIGG